MKNLFFLTVKSQAKNEQALLAYSPDVLKRWLSDIPTGNYGMAARALHERITQLNGVEAKPLVRLDALELMRPTFLMIEGYLRARISSSGFPLTENQQKIGALLAQITRDYAIAYWLVVRDLTRKTGGWFQNKQIALAIQRVISGLNGVLLAHYLTGRAVPNWAWLDLHSLYKLARQKKKEAVRVRDDSQQGKFTSIENTYKQILLASLADPCGLLQKEILEAYAFAEKVAAFVELPSAASSSGTRCLVLTDEDKSPVWLETDGEHEKGTIVYQVMLDKVLEFCQKHPEKVADARLARFKSITAAEEPEGLLSPELAGYLIARWSGRPLEGDTCFADRQDRLFAIGLKATHSQLAPIDVPESAGAEWVVESASDRSLSCSFDRPNQIFIGSLVSFRRNNGEYTQRALGTVCKIHTSKSQGTVKFEVRLLTPQVYAVGTQALSTKDPQLYQRTLLYVDRAESKRTYIILESQKLKDGDVIRLLLQNDSFPIRLKCRRNIGLGYWQFECTRVVQQQNAVTLPKKGYDFV